MDVDVSNTPLVGAWTPGDSIGIVAPNSDELVLGLCSRLGISAQCPVKISPAGTASTVPPSHSVPPLTGSRATDSRFCSPWVLSAYGLVSRESLQAQACNPTDSASAASSSASVVLACSDVFRWCVDLTSIPPRGLIRLLAEFSSDPSDRDQLIFLLT
jgi:hypothetical protein